LVYHLNVNEIPSFADKLSAGDEVFLSGIVYTARDAAHKRIFSMMEKGEELPFDIKGAVIYYAGPTPSRPGLPIGSCGPTTSSRMDVFAPTLLDMGLCAMIGKGKRSKEVCDAVIRNKAVYFCALGGAGALYASCIKECEVIAFDELGCESLKRMKVEKFPVFVAIDSRGGNIFDRK
jgi:fumarate hydratase subunit beta